MKALPFLLAAAVLTADPPLDRLAWLGGCWESRSGERVVLETWMPPSGGLMVGGSRTVVGGEARAWEHLRIRAEGDGIVYTAVPSGQAETDFRSTSVEDDGFVVENPDHDFPTRIAYRRESPEAFTATVEGPGPGGSRGFRIDFERVACRTGGSR